ncbi:MAG: hypothetical protein QW292_05835, partial [Candidatus Parvarchaeota archaeon]
MSEHIPDSGYDKKLNVNYSILLDTLKALDYDDFLRACPRYPEFVTEIDISKLFMFRGIAESFAEEEIDIGENITDYREFERVKGEIVAAITREIRRGNPRNLQYEATEKAMEDMNALTGKTIEKIMQEEEFMQKMGEEFKKYINENKKMDPDIIRTINQMHNEIISLKRQIEEMKEERRNVLSELESLPSPPRVEKPDETQPSILEFSKPRKWQVYVTDDGNIDILNEVRGNEEGGDIPVEITDGENSVLWKVKCTQQGHSILYERSKKIMNEYLLDGRVTTTLMYSYPQEGEKRIFSPEIRNGRVHYL